MRSNANLPMHTTLRNKRWKPVFFQGCPRWQRATRSVKIVGDVSKLKFNELEYLFAIFASNLGTQFVLGSSEECLSKWFLSVARRSVGAAEKYEQKLRRHFSRYKMRFIEGYSLPLPPTPELRLIYDSAARGERRATRPCGTSLYPGFSGGEYHWQSWPLRNVVFAGNSSE